MKRPRNSIMVSIRNIGKYMARIITTRGINQNILILKIAYIAVKQYLAGTPLNHTNDLGQRVSLVHGLPKFLPLQIRNQIRSHEIKHIRLILSLLCSYKGMEGKYSDPSLSTIEAPTYKSIDISPFSPSVIKPIVFDTLDIVTELSESFWRFINPRKIPLDVKIDSSSPPFTLSATANGNVGFNNVGSDAAYHILDKTEDRDPYLQNYINVALKGYPDSDLNHVWTACVNSARFYLSSTDNDPCSLKGGRLAIKLEPAGKVRVFAISDYWTQWVMKPVHDSMFKVLRNISSDATFNQTEAVKQFASIPHDYIASYDLKSATDLIPKALYNRVFLPWMDAKVDGLTHMWLNLLTRRDYHYKGKTYRYTRGQPMGTLSSWASLAIVHHFLVFMAASRVHIRNFRDYLVLGDDIVIGNKLVADSYARTCTDLGITIGLPKSYTSTKRFFEFASQDMLGETNLSPVSLREILAISSREQFKTRYQGLSALASKVEFHNRLQERGYFESRNLFSSLKAISSVGEWRIISRSLTRGVLPPLVKEKLLSLLASSLRTEANNVRFHQLMAVLNSDMRLLSNASLLDDQRVNHFVQDLIELLNSRIEELISKIKEELDNKEQINPWESTDNRAAYLMSLLLLPTERNKALTLLKSVEERYEKVSSVVGPTLQQNKWSYLFGHEQEFIDFSLFNVYNAIIRDLSMISLDISIKKDAKLAISREEPPRSVKLFLSYFNQSPLFRETTSVSV